MTKYFAPLVALLLAAPCFGQAVGIPVGPLDPHGNLRDIAQLADPNAARVLKWNDTSNAIEWAVDATGGGSGDVDAFAADPSSNANLNASNWISDLGLAGLFQPLDSDLTAFAAKTAPTGAVVGTSDTQTLTAKTVDLTSNTLVGSVSEFNAALESADFYTSGGTDVAVADGGTGVSTLTGIVKGNGASAFTAAVAGTDYLAPAAIGVTVQAFDADLADLADGTLTGSKVSGAVVVSGGTIDNSVIGGSTPAAITGTTITATTSVTTVDDAYDASTWNGSNTVPTKNAVRDKIESLVAGGGLGTTDIDTSGELSTIVTDETGSGALVFGASPTLTTPNLGTPSAITLTNGTGLPISTGVSGLGTGVATALATPSSANLATAVTNETGSGLLVFATSPTLTTPNLGTPSAATLTNATGLPISTGVSGLGSGVATMLGTPSSANVAAAVTGETGSGALVFGTSPAIASPTITGTGTAIFSTVTVDHDAYSGTSWNGENSVPTKDAVRDQIAAMTSATYITQTANSTLSGEQALGSLATGLLKNTTTTGVLSIAAEGTDYVAPAPVVRVSSTGAQTYYGAGAADATAVGTAIAATAAAASSGDVIYVWADSALAATIVLESGVDWWFSPGTTHTFSTDDEDGYIFDDNAVACAVTIGGRGNFTREVTAGAFTVGTKTCGVLKVANAASHVSFHFGQAHWECPETGPEADQLLLYHLDGELYLDGDIASIDSASVTPGTTVLWWENGDLNGRIKELVDESPVGGHVCFYSIVTSTPTGDARFSCENIQAASFDESWAIFDNSTEVDAAIWIDAKTIKGRVDHQGDAKLYVEAQKLLGRVTQDNGSGLLYLHFMKVGNPFASGQPACELADGTSWISVDQFAPDTNWQELIEVSGGTHNVTGLDLTAASSQDAVLVSGGTLNLLGGKITNGGGGKVDLKQTGGTLNVAPSVVYGSTSGAITRLMPVTRTISVILMAPTTAATTGDGKAYIPVPASMNGGVITAAHLQAVTAGATGTTDVQIANVTDAVDVLSTKLTIDSTETGSQTAATPAVINASNDDLATNDLLRIDVDAVSSTPPQGLIVTIEVTK